MPDYGLPSCLRAPNLPTGSKPAYGLQTSLPLRTPNAKGGSPAPLALPPRAGAPRPLAGGALPAGYALQSLRAPVRLRMRRGAPLPPSHSPRGFRVGTSSPRVRSVAVLAPWAVLRFTRPRSSWLCYARSYQRQSVGVARARARPTQYG